MITSFQAGYSEVGVYLHTHCLFYLHKRLDSTIQNTIKLNQQCYIVMKHKNLTSLLILKDVIWSNNINS